MIGTASSIINDHMNRTAEMIEENASNSFAEADIKKVLGYIKQTGEKGIKHGDLVKKLWRMSANNRKNAISTLLESEQVSAEQVDTGHGKAKIATDMWMVMVMVCAAMTGRTPWFGASQRNQV